MGETKTGQREWEGPRQGEIRTEAERGGRWGKIRQEKARGRKEGGSWEGEMETEEK